GDLEPELAVAVGERLHRAVELLLDEPAHREHGAADVLEVLVEPPRDVMTEVFDFHRVCSHRRRRAAPLYTTIRPRAPRYRAARRARPGSGRRTGCPAPR